MASSPTLEELRVTADQATAKFNDAQRRLLSAASELVDASAARHAAVVAMVNAPPPPAATAPKTANRLATAATVSASATIDAAEARYDKALADFQQTRRDLGLST